MVRHFLYFASYMQGRANKDWCKKFSYVVISVEIWKCKCVSKFPGLRTVVQIVRLRLIFDWESFKRRENGVS